MLTSKWHVGLLKIHAKGELVEGAEIAWFRHCADARLGVVHHQCVHLGDKVGAVGMLACIGTGVPQDGVGGLDGVVYGDGVGSLVHGARGQDVDGGGHDGDRGVVPSKGHPVADLVVLRTEDGVRGDHLHASRLDVGAEVGDLGLARGLGGLLRRVSLVGRLGIAALGPGRLLGLRGLARGLFRLLGSFGGLGLLVVLCGGLVLV